MSLRFMGLGYADARRGALAWFGPVGPIKGTFRAMAVVAAAGGRSLRLIPEVIELDGVPLLRPFFPVTISPENTIRVAVKWPAADGPAAAGLMGEFLP